MSQTIALSLLLCAALESCALPVNYEAAQHEADLDRLVLMRPDYTRNPPALDPSRAVQEEDCTKPISQGEMGNLYCQ